MRMYPDERFIYINQYKIVGAKKLEKDDGEIRLKLEAINNFGRSTDDRYRYMKLDELLDNMVNNYMHILGYTVTNVKNKLRLTKLSSIMGDDADKPCRVITSSMTTRLLNWIQSAVSTVTSHIEIIGGQPQVVDKVTRLGNMIGVLGEVVNSVEESDSKEDISDTDIIWRNGILYTKDEYIEKYGELDDKTIIMVHETSGTIKLISKLPFIIIGTHEIFGSDSLGATIKLSGIETRPMINMRGLFTSGNWVNIDLSEFDMSYAINLDLIFFYCSVGSIILKDNQELLNAKTARQMFADIDLSSLIRNYEFNPQGNHIFDVVQRSKIEIADAMFANCRGIRHVVFSGRTFKHLKSANFMFKDCDQIEEVRIENCEFPRLVSADAVFSGCTELEIVNVLNSKMNELQRIRSAFENCSNLADCIISNVKLDNLESTSAMFKSAGIGCHIKLSEHSTPMLKNTSYMFRTASIGKIDLAGIDFSKVTHSIEMFSYCSAKDIALDFSHNPFESLIYAVAMFDNAEFGALDASNIVMAGIIDANAMFNGVEVSGKLKIPVLDVGPTDLTHNKLACLLTNVSCYTNEPFVIDFGSNKILHTFFGIIARFFVDNLVIKNLNYNGIGTLSSDVGEEVFQDMYRVDDVTQPVCDGRAIQHVNYALGNKVSSSEYCDENDYFGEVSGCDTSYASVSIKFEHTLEDISSVKYSASGERQRTQITFENCIGIDVERLRKMYPNVIFNEIKS